jgi:putative transcriptional regulator
MTPLRLRIRELRDEKGLSQQELGDLAGVRQATISELESGKAQRLDLKTLERLAIALDVEPGTLIERLPRRKR